MSLNLPRALRICVPTSLLLTSALLTLVGCGKPAAEPAQAPAAATPAPAKPWPRQASGDFAWDDRFLRAKGDLIVDGKGTPVHLKGFGIGGWHLLEGYMIGSPGPCPGDRAKNPYCRTDRYIRKHVIDKIGQEKADRFFRQYVDNHFSENEVAQLAAWGFNSIRLAINGNQLMLDDAPKGPPYTYLEAGFRVLDNAIEWATKHNVYVILDLHAAPGAQVHHNIADAVFEGPIDGVPGETICGKDRLWDEPEVFWPRTIDLWVTLARRYGRTPTVIGYEFLNEPMMPGVEQECEPESKRSAVEPWTRHDNKPLFELYAQLSEALRNAGDRKIHIAEAAFWGQNFIGLQEPWDENLVYAWHVYPVPRQPSYFETEGKTAPSYRPILELAVPMYMSESGESDKPEEAAEFATFMLAANLGQPMAWSWWTHKKAGTRKTQPWLCPFPESYQRLLDDWNGTSAADAETALFEFAESLRTDRCQVNTELVRALGGKL